MRDPLLADADEVLRLADRYIVSRLNLFSREAVFTAKLTTGAIWLDGSRCRLTWVYPGILRVFVEATGEVLAESVPGKPLSPRYTKHKAR